MELDDQPRWDRLRVSTDPGPGAPTGQTSPLREFSVGAVRLDRRVLHSLANRTEDVGRVEDDTMGNTDPVYAGTPIEITEVRVTLKSQGQLRALCSVTFAGVFVARGIKVIEGPDRFFLAMPSRRESDGKYRDICHPIDTPFRCWLERQVVEAYLRKVEAAAQLSGELPS